MTTSPLQDFLYRPDEDTSGLERISLGRGEVPPSGTSEPPVGMLLLRLGPRTCALPLLAVREIVRPPILTELPRGPEEVLGVMLLRGEVLPVYEPKRKLGIVPGNVARAGPDAQPPPRSARIVVVADAEGPAGLWVDAVEGVVRVAPSQMKTLDVLEVERLLA